jgi:hypothetical protein
MGFMESRSLYSSVADRWSRLSSSTEPVRQGRGGLSQVSAATSQEGMIMILRSEIRIQARPEHVMEFFEAMEENYTRWHPDHHRFEWIEGRGVAEGVVFEFDEEVAGKRQKREALYTHVVEGQHLEFAPTSKLIRLFLPRMLFRLSPQGDGLLFVQELHVRIGPLGAWLNRNEFEAVRQHMKEEGENLKRLLEGGKGGASPA